MLAHSSTAADLQPKSLGIHQHIPLAATDDIAAHKLTYGRVKAAWRANQTNTATPAL